VNREEAIALLKQIVETERFSFNWISLVNGKSGCMIKLKPDEGNSDVLKPIFEKRGLEVKEVEGILVVYRNHDRKSELLKN
jgi:hypothetical protein